MFRVDNELLIMLVSLLNWIVIIGISILINQLTFINKIKSKPSMKNIVFGMVIVLLGMFLYNISNNCLYRKEMLNIIKTIIPIYLIATGATISFIGYKS